MEARASFHGASVSRTFVAAVMVIVAMGLAAMGGYAARTLTGGGAAAAPAQGVVHPAAGTVLRQDNPVSAPVQLPWYIEGEITAQPSPRLLQDDPNFIARYAPPAPAAPQERSTGHKEL